MTFVGAPCYGKSLAAHKISRNLFWKGEDVKGRLKDVRALIGKLFSFISSVFSVDEAATIATLQDVTEWFKTGHNVAVSGALKKFC